MNAFLKPRVFRQALCGLGVAALFSLGSVAQAQPAPGMGPCGGPAGASQASGCQQPGAGGPMGMSRHGMHAQAGQHGLLPGGHMLERLLDDVKATPEQREQIRKITQAAHDDLKAQHEAGKGLREQMLQALTGATPDAKAAESVRQQMLARHDAASKREVQALLDVMKALTPEQRKQVAERMKQMAQRAQDGDGPMGGRHPGGIRR